MESKLDSIEVNNASIEGAAENDNSMEGAERIVVELRKEFPTALKVITTVGEGNKIVSRGILKVGEEEIESSIVSFNAEFENSSEASAFSRKLEELNGGIKSDVVGIDHINISESEGSQEKMSPNLGKLVNRRIFNVSFILICPTEVANKLFN
jgi:hypothetical protein